MPKRSSILLINEPPLQTLPSLACLVGLNGAIILQQIQYWIQVSEHKIEGEVWIYNSYDKWAKQFKWLKPRAVQKHILALERGGFLISKQFRYKTRNNTKWYRIDYDRLDEEYQRLIDREESNSLKPKSNGDGEESNGHSHLSSHKTKLNSRQTTQKTTQKNKIIEIWVETLEILKDQVNKANFRTWLKDTVPLSFDGEAFVVGTKSTFAAEYLNHNQRSLIEKTLTEVVGQAVIFVCQVAPVKEGVTK